MKEMLIRNGRLILDDEDYQDLRFDKITATKSGSVSYHGAYKKHPLGKVIMHVMFEDNLVVVHRNGNKMDFRKDNLEIISKGELARKFAPKIDDDDEVEEIPVDEG